MVGSLATVISLGLGMVIAQCYDGTVLPLVLGFAAVGPAVLAALDHVRSCAACLQEGGV